MTEVDLQAIEARVSTATAGPWRDITVEWNLAQRDYLRCMGRHRHGPLAGTKKIPAKECAALIVVDEHRGKRLDFTSWRGDPDWYDLQKVMALPYDLLFPVKPLRTRDIDARLGSGNFGLPPDRAFVTQARQDVEVLLAEVRRLRALLANAEGATRRTCEQ